MTAITIDDVKRLATLSALVITDQQAEALRKQLDDILGYVAQLDDVDTTGVEPTYQVGGLENVMRDDTIKDYHVSRDDLLKNAPALEDGSIKVKRVL
ncbi:MAG: Asp-tRNA(Asn)/Glu-tRNA(Gln) amidotransferase subunit GatC [Candidatus Saccharimonadales bacterium]